MLRVGITGQLGSGKSTVAAMLGARGAHVFSADEIGRELMQPGHAVYDAVVRTFGPDVVKPDGSLDRAALAREVFSANRIEELNAIVHPAVIVEQQRRMAELFAREPQAIAVVESALIFEAERDAARRGTSDPVLGWRNRFDKIILVTASEQTRLDRFVARALSNSAAPPSAEREAELREDARRRMAVQIPDSEKASQVDFILANDGPPAGLETQVDALWRSLQKANAGSPLRSG